MLNLELLIVNYLGGPDRDRTGDLYIANVALCQLSYRPKCASCLPAVATGLRIPISIGTAKSRVAKEGATGPCPIYQKISKKNKKSPPPEISSKQHEDNQANQTAAREGGLEVQLNRQFVS